MKCPECNFESPADTLYCGKCGTKLNLSEPVLGTGPTNNEISFPHTKTLQTPIKGLITGTTFAGRYQVIEELGKGGMDVVYKAKDSKLKRTVALKFISPQILAGKEEKSRFVREAQAAAALNHPNICTVYEIDEAEGKSFITMEYIEGQSLKKKVKLRPLKLNEALDISIQAAEGLRQAHEKGIVHRDIKSANIMVTEKGQAKIMDFGLAKLAGTTLITKEGTAVGTIAYMSPEQAHGEDLDHRTDIWSLGVVLYEIIAGQLPFRGEYDQAVVYSILNENPQPLTALRSGIPLEFERIVNKCLEKDPSYRYQGASDFLADLKRMKRDLDTEKTPALREMTPGARRRPGISKRFRLAALALSAFLVCAAVYYFILKPRNAPIHRLSALRLTPLTSRDGLSVFPSWSPDGTWVAYASDEAGNLDIWKKPIEGGKAVQLTRGPYNESQPAWSPDGRNIAYFSDLEGGGIFLIPSGGGTPWRLTSFGANPTWSANNETLAFDWCGNIYLVSYTGGEPRLVVSGTSATPYMAWAPDGERIIFWNRTKGDIYVFSINEGESKPLKLIPSGQEVSGLTLSKDGQEMVLSLGPFGGNKNLWKVDIDPNTINPIGDLFPLSVTATEDIQCAFSPDGSKLAFTVSQLERHLWALSIDPVSGLITGEPERITFKSKHNYYPACSPDGRMLVWTSHLTTQGVLSTKNLEKHEEKKVTREWGQKTREVGGSFSPDGKQICYASTLGGSYEIWRMPSFGSIGLQLTETKHPIRDALTDWSPNGEVIAFYSNRSGNWDIWSVQTSGRSQPRQLTHWKSNELYPSWSPDGRFLAFRTDKEGNADIWIMDSDGGNPHPYVTHSADEGWSAWSPDGRWFYFISNRSGVFNVWIKPTGGGVERQVTAYKGLSSGLPDSVLFTKFAVSSSCLIVPLETRRGNIYILENIK